MKLYMAVTPDKFEFPVFIEESCIALEQKTGVNHNNIYSYISKNLSGKKLGYKFVIVEIEEDTI